MPAGAGRMGWLIRPRYLAPSGILVGAVLGQTWTASGPALEGAGEGACVREAEHEGHTLHGTIRPLQILIGKLFAQVVQHFLEGSALFLETAQQGAFGHIHQLRGSPT